MSAEPSIGGIAEVDPFQARLAVTAVGLLRSFNRAGVLSAADVQVARRLAALADAPSPASEDVLLAVALAVRAPRLGHVLVDLTTIRHTAAVEAEQEVDLEALAWPDPSAWVNAVAGSPLVAAEAETDAVRPLRLRGSQLYLDRYWAEEVAVAETLRRMLAEDGGNARPAAPELAERLARLFPDDPDGRQAQAVAAAARRRFAVIAGGPGTGKTTTVARIVASLCEAADEGPPPLIALVAPTGKAATRLEAALHAEARRLAVGDAVRDAMLALRASTIHRLLGWRPDSGSRFRHDRDHRLAHDVVIVDETSMVSLSLMARLIEALRASARLVLVGDPGQLASIEAGAVLGDIVGDGAGRADMAAEATTGSTRSVAERERAGIIVLDRGHRFGGAIADLAAAIRAGDGDAVIEVLRAGAEDVQWIQGDPGRPETFARLRAPALGAARGILRAAEVGDGRGALGALGRFRILCAHRRGPHGVAGWTARVEGWLREGEPGFSATDRWYVGRPLLVTENDYELGLSNGDTGVVIRGPEDGVLAAFERAGADDPRGPGSGSGVTYSPSRLGSTDTVYAMTIHKSQGSQFDAAAVLLPEPGSRLLTRELLYTAATRARTRLILVGPEETIRAAVARRVARASGLGERLWGGPARPGPDPEPAG